MSMLAPLLAAALAAHPLGDFSVNHYDGLTIRPDRIEHLAIVDSALDRWAQAAAAWPSACSISPRW
jgi:hypothetical protein